MHVKLAAYGATTLLSVLLLVLAATSSSSKDGSWMLSTSLSIVAMILATALCCAEHVKYNIGSMLLTAYWLLNVFAHAVSMRTYVNHGMSTASSFFVVYAVQTAFCVLLLVVEGCWKTETKGNAVPEAHAAPFTRATFMWMAHLMHLGSKRVITMADLYENNAKLQSETLYEQYLSVKSSRTKASPLPIWSILRRSQTPLLMSFLCEVANVVSVFVLPLLVDRLLAFVKSWGTGSKTPPQPVAYGYCFAVGMLLFSLLQAVFYQQRIHFAIQAQLRLQAMLMNAIHHKAMSLSLVGRGGSSVGEIVNHMSVDTVGMTYVLFQGNDLWSAPLTIVIALVQLWQYLGIASLCGFGVLLVLTPALGAAIQVVMKQQDKKLKNMDERIKLITEVIAGMKMIKLYATESYFVQKILGYRAREQKALRTVSTGFAVVFGVTTALSTVIAVVSFGVYAAIGKADAPLDSTRVFMSLYYIRLLDGPLNTLFSAFELGSRAVVSYRRLSQFLAAPEIDSAAVKHDLTARDTPVAASISQGTFAWHDDSSEQTEDATRFALSDINVQFARKNLTAVIGRVGQGKSSLLHALLGEMIKRSGQVEVNGSIAYVAQAAWIINGTLRDNILMGLPMDEKKYRRTLYACSLLPDMKVLEHGDMTAIGDKGVNLSGGQRARVSLARAVYADADIYLLDDCLSAVDAHVDKHIFAHVIGKDGMLGKKTVILVTHGVHHLEHCDRVLYLRDGAVVEQGAFAELMASDSDVRALVTEYSLKEEKKTAAEEGASNAEDAIGASTQHTLHSEVEPATDIDATLLPLTSTEAPMEQSDENVTGKVGLDVYKNYLLAMGTSNLVVFVLLVIGIVGSQVASQLWLQQMANQIDQKQSKPLIYYLGIYCGLSLAVVIFNSLGNFWVLVRMCITACKVLHTRLLQRVFRAQPSWLDKIPAGRIINRFSSDTDALDGTVPFNFINFVYLLCAVIVSVIVIVVPMPWMAVPLVVSFVALMYVQRYFLATSREIKRLDSGSKTPIYQLFGESITGIVSVRAYNYQTQIVKQLEERVDNYIRAVYANYGANRWLAISVNAIGSFVIFGVAILAVLLRSSTAGAQVGMGFVGSQSLVVCMIYLIRSLCDLEANITSVERIHSYCSLPVEAAEHDAAVEAAWPSAGTITFTNYTTAYQAESDDAPTKPVLRDLNLTIRGGEKIGICGRTGAGKSTITLSLFRILEAVQGRIEIDGQDISKVGLADLRSRLTIIPQDPMLFQGTVRSNLDPLGKHSDVEVWRALEHASLKEYIAALEGGLEGAVETGGSNFSAGQKQLLTLAAALLRKQRIVIFDEATSATDAETDTIVQRTIRSEFKDCTVLTIAHRIATIMDSDRILVLDQGQVAEFDTPQALLQNAESAFAKLVESTRTH
ncbi:hypothetical protein RI367_003520 [Sorochytrium milnesiophthora]